MKSSRDRVSPGESRITVSARVAIDRSIRGRRLSDSPAFLAARVFTVSLLVAIYVWLLVGLARAEPELSILRRYAFYVIAALFFLQPTQNPWYWLWAMALVCFAPNRGRLLVATCLFAYYFRFWYKFPNVGFEFGSIRYHGVGCFDDCIAWLEYLPIAVAVIGWWWIDQRSARSRIQRRLEVGMPRRHDVQTAGSPWQYTFRISIFTDLTRRVTKMKLLNNLFRIAFVAGCVTVVGCGTSEDTGTTPPAGSETEAGSDEKAGSEMKAGTEEKAESESATAPE